MKALEPRVVIPSKNGVLMHLKQFSAGTFYVLCSTAAIGLLLVRLVKEMQQTIFDQTNRHKRKIN